MTYPPDTPSSTYHPDPTYPADETATYPSVDPSSTYPTEVAQPLEFGSDSETGSDTSTAELAKEQAAQVSGSAVQAGQQVAETAKEQAANVAEQAKSEAKNLLGQTRDELSSQAGTQQQRIAGGLRSLGEELQAMAGHSETDGPATQAARQAAQRIDSAASWLEGREPGQVLTEVSRFARQRPGAFLALAAVAGLAAGRLTRGLTADSSSATSQPGDYQSAVAGQPDNGWQTGGTAASGTAPNPSGYGSGIPAPEGFGTTTGSPTALAPDPMPPAGQGGYPDPRTSGTGR